MLQQSRIPSLSLAFLVGIPVVCLSPLHSVERIHICTQPCNAHVSLPLQLPSSLTVGPLAKSCVSHPCIVRACVDRDSTIWFFILFYFTLVAEPRSSASGLDRSTQQGELRSSAMSGGTDRREDGQVPQFYGRIDEKFAEWETDVRLWLSSRWKTVTDWDQGCIGEVCTDNPKSL